MNEYRTIHIVSVMENKNAAHYHVSIKDLRHQFFVDAVRRLNGPSAAESFEKRVRCMTLSTVNNCIWSTVDQRL